jgi:RimJ/RimL family protein N-acetyltransferase
MKVKRFSKLDTLQDSIKIVSKKTGESLTINRFKSFVDILGKFIKRLREWSNKRPSFDIYLGSEKVAELNLIEKSKEELNIMWIETYEDYRGKGYSQAILTELIRFAKSQGYKYLTLEVPGKSPDARHIYKKLGFEDDGILTTPEEDSFWGGLTKMKLKLFSKKKKKLPQGKQVSYKDLDKARNRKIDVDTSDDAIEIASQEIVNRENNPSINNDTEGYVENSDAVKVNHKFEYFNEYDNKKVLK